MNIIVITEKQYEYFKYKILIDALEKLFEDIEDKGVSCTPPTKNKKEN